LAFIITGIILLVLFFVILSSAVGGAFSMFDEKPFVYEDKTVLHMDIKDVVTEKSFAALNTSSFSIDKAIGIREIKIALKAAKTDKKVEGILLDMSSMSAGMASTEEIRNALLDFKKSDKFLIAYSENYTQKSYYLGTAADEIYAFPEGMVDFRGLGAELMFFKGMIDKLGVDVQIIRGSNNKFKSAVEPFFLDSMSDANRKQTMTYLDAMWNQMLKGISETRGISIADLNEIADSVYVRNPEAAVKYKLIDAVKYEDEIMSLVCEKAGVKKEEDLNIIDFSKYAYHTVKRVDNKVKDEDKNIAVVYAVGGIESGKGNNTTMGSETVAKALKEARTDDNIKAIVLRINSPGGSALASDVIWREVILAKATKPLVVSMGDLAASGGYYIACAADKIYAQPNTITGSIGVFGVIPNFGPMLKDKVGITTSIVETNEHSASMSVLNALSEEEKLIIQEGVDDIYMDFTTKVAEGRGMTQAEVDSIGQGRVWAGTDAINIGLVDELGGIDDALGYAAEKAGVKTSAVKVKVYPASDNKLMDLLKQFEMMEEQQDEESLLKQKMVQMLETMETVSSMRGMQVRLPYQITIE
jgi:protease-4